MFRNSPELRRREMSGPHEITDGPEIAVAPIAVIGDHGMFGQSLAMALSELGFPTRQVPHVTGARAHGVHATPTDAERERRRLALVMHTHEHDVECGGEHPPGDVRHPSEELVTALRNNGWMVIMLASVETSPTAADAAAAAIAAGAAGVVDTARSFATLVDSLSRAAAGHPPISELERRRWLAHHHAAQHRRRQMINRVGQLSPREREILFNLYHGQHAAAIAERFGSSLSTVRSQIKSILTKLDVHSQLEAVALLHNYPLIRSLVRPAESGTVEPVRKSV